MRIGIDCRVLNLEKQRAGVAQYTYHLVKSILALNGSMPEQEKNEYVLFWAGEPLPEFILGGVDHISVGHGLPFYHSHWSVARLIDNQRLDLVHFPAGSVPLFLKTPFVVTVHDLAFFRHPEWFPAQPFSRLVTPSLWRQASRIIAVSAFTRSELVSLFNFKAEIISVVPEGRENMKTTESGSIKGVRDYFLFIGTIEPRKNIDTLLTAFESLKTQFPEVDLVVIGRPGWKCEQILKRLSQTPDVKWLGYLPQEEKNNWLINAKSLIYPSLYEGFGLPVLEAMAAGVPVITSNTTALKELADGAALTINPTSSRELTAAMEKILREPTLVESLKQKGRAQAAEFTWERAAKETISVYRGV